MAIYRITCILSVQFRLIILDIASLSAQRYLCVRSSELKRDFVTLDLFTCVLTRWL